MRTVGPDRNSVAARMRTIQVIRMIRTGVHADGVTAARNIRIAAPGGVALPQGESGPFAPQVEVGEAEGRFGQRQVRRVQSHPRDQQTSGPQHGGQLPDDGRLGPCGQEGMTFPAASTTSNSGSRPRVSVRARSPRIHSCAGASRRATASIEASMSTPVQRYPSPASRIAIRPVPQPASSTRAGAPPARRRTRPRHGCRAPIRQAARNAGHTAPRPVRRSVPPSGPVSRSCRRALRSAPPGGRGNVFEGNVPKYAAPIRSRHSSGAQVLPKHCPSAAGGALRRAQRVALAAVRTSARTWRTMSERLRSNSGSVT